jgi:hypothetical protein
MKKLIALLAVLALPALAGERILGEIVSGAGADTTNQSTAVPFAIPPNTKVTVVCNGSANVCVSSATACTNLAGANPGVPVTANEKFPTSTNSGNSTTTAKRANQGATNVVIGGQVSSLIRIVGAAAVTCTVWSRKGDE